MLESINRGWSCVYGSEEDGLILGYQKDGQEWLCHHPYKPKQAYFVEKDQLWGIGVVYEEKKSPPPDRRKCAVESLKLANTDKVGDYFCGQKAQETWLVRLRDEALFAEADEETRRAMMHGNAWIYECLIDARKCAAEYLSGVTGDLPEAADQMSQAAQLYNQQTERLRAGWPHAPFPHQQDEMSWSQEMRRAQADALEEAWALEKQALAQIEKSLDVIKQALREVNLP